MTADRTCPRWQRIRSAVGDTVRGATTFLDVDPDRHADRIWLVTRNTTEPAGRLDETLLRRAQTGAR